MSIPSRSALIQIKPKSICLRIFETQDRERTKIQQICHQLNLKSLFNHQIEPRADSIDLVVEKVVELTIAAHENQVSELRLIITLSQNRNSKLSYLKSAIKKATGLELEIIDC